MQPLPSTLPALARRGRRGYTDGRGEAVAEARRGGPARGRRGMKVERMKAARIVFGEEGAELREYRLRALRRGELLVRARCSLVSIGTETTLYLARRWQAPPAGAAAGGAVEDDEWDFEDYGRGET